jgi:beta-N-acetylhexosaminidase
MPELIEIAGRLGEIVPKARERLERAMAGRGVPEGDLAELIAKRDELLAQA